jgi:hypothetical protein
MERRKRNMSLKPKAVATGILLSKKNIEVMERSDPNLSHNPMTKYKIINMKNLTNDFMCTN